MSVSLHTNIGSRLLWLAPRCGIRIFFLFISFASVFDFVRFSASQDDRYYYNYYNLKAISS